MNRIGLFAVLAALTVTSAYAQQRYDPAIPRGLPDQRVGPSRELSPTPAAPRPPRLIQNARRAQRDADARHCLNMGSNKGIHRCSLKYRSRASRAARVKKASAKPPAAPAAAKAEITRPPSGVMKPGAPRPGDAAKAADLVKPMDVTKPAAVPKPVESAKAPQPAKAATPPVKPAAPGAPPPLPAKAPERK
jgi:hypothetical protein